MKVRYSLLVLIPISIYGYFSFLKAQPILEPEYFLDSVHDLDAKKLNEVLTLAEKKFEHQPALYKSLITTADRDGWNVLLHKSVDGTPEDVQEIINSLRRYYRDDPTAIAPILSLTSKDGRSALHLAVLRNRLDTVTTLLKSAEEIFGKQRDLFLEWINIAENTHRWTPLMLASNNSVYPLVKIIMDTAARVLGVGSPEFKIFLNAKDKNKVTAATYAESTAAEFFRDYGVPEEQMLWTFTTAKKAKKVLPLLPPTLTSPIIQPAFARKAVVIDRLEDQGACPSPLLIQAP